jgi:hypothetical protein
MTWSDRGGASRTFGEAWAERCWQLLQAGDARTGVLRERLGADIYRYAVIRLDNNPRIALQAGRHKLPNPDFVVVGHDRQGRDHLYAVDAKFAIDRIRRSQISPESMESLIALPGGIVRQEIERQSGITVSDEPEYQDGLFIGPRHPINDFFQTLHVRSKTTEIEPDEIVLVPVSADELFGTTPEKPVIDLLVRLDDLKFRGDQELIAGMYYLRLACAAKWFHQELEAPLLTLRPPRRPDPIEVEDELRSRMDGHATAFNVIASWARETDRQLKTREAIRHAATLPLRMDELRAAAESVGRRDDRKLVRSARGLLETQYMRRLIEEVGEVPARPHPSVNAVLDRIRSANRALQPEIRRNIPRVFSHLLDE